ncbi:MAG: AbrB/MazE/SpoVT family DNA-binding domain-containing protein [Candidatus Methanoperedens sp.]|nr:AbrB/MazE/SpoVT family DNA-binding domain-containing protein [Candidatus Methanoperedens sp.]
MQKIRMMGKGQVVIPARIRKKLNITEGSMLAVEEAEGVIKLMPKVKLRSLWGTWPELDIETVSKEIIEDREHEEEIEKAREKKRERVE